MNFGLYVNELKNDDSVRIVVMHHMMTGLVTMTYNGSSITEALKEIMINAVETDWFPYSPKLVNDEDCLHFKFYEMNNDRKQIKDSYYDIFIDGYYGYREDDNENEDDEEKEEIINEDLTTKMVDPFFIDEIIDLLNVDDYNEIYKYGIPQIQSHWWLRSDATSHFFAYVSDNGVVTYNGASGSHGVRPILNYKNIVKYLKFTNEGCQEFYFNDTLFVVINLVDCIAIANESLCEMKYDFSIIRLFLHEWFKDGLNKAINDLKEGEE